MATGARLGFALRGGAARCVVGVRAEHELLCARAARAGVCARARVCVCACARACVCTRASMRVRACACVRMRVALGYAVCVLR